MADYSDLPPDPIKICIPKAASILLQPTDTICGDLYRIDEDHFIFGDLLYVCDYIIHDSHAFIIICGRASSLDNTHQLSTTLSASCCPHQLLCHVDLLTFVSRASYRNCFPHDVTHKPYGMDVQELLGPDVPLSKPLRDVIRARSFDPAFLVSPETGRAYVVKAVVGRTTIAIPRRAGPDSIRHGRWPARMIDRRHAGVEAEHQRVIWLSRTADERPMQIGGEELTSHNVTNRHLLYSRC